MKATCKPIRRTPRFYVTRFPGAWLPILAAFFLTGAGVVFGQGTVNFVNTSLTLVKLYDGTPINPAGEFYFGLFIAPEGTTDPNAFTFTGIYATNLWVPGRISGGFNLPVNSWSTGQRRAFLVRGWSADGGHDWNPFGQSIYRCISPIATGIAGGGTMPPLPIFGAIGINSELRFDYMCLGCGFYGIYSIPNSQTVGVGQQVEFSVSAGGCPPPRYRWYFNGELIPMATGARYRISMASKAHEGAYMVEVLGLAGCIQQYLTQYLSPPAILRVLEPPRIVSHPRTQNAYLDSTVRLNVGVSGDQPLSCQWYFQTTQPISHGTNRTLVLSNISLAQSGRYHLVVANQVGTATSAAAVLTLSPAVNVTSRLALQIAGTPGESLDLESSESLNVPDSWTDLATLTLTNNPVWWFDPTPALPTQRYYRARHLGVAKAPAVLRPHLLPTISISGSVGTRLFLEYINQFGPTDTWTRLVDLQISASPLVYFDTNSIGQPPRIYRVLSYF